MYCCGTKGELRKFTTFEYWHCNVCKQEIMERKPLGDLDLSNGNKKSTGTLEVTINSVWIDYSGYKTQVHRNPVYKMIVGSYSQQWNLTLRVKAGETLELEVKNGNRKNETTIFRNTSGKDGHYSFTGSVMPPAYDFARCSDRVDHDTVITDLQANYGTQYVKDSLYI